MTPADQIDLGRGVAVPGELVTFVPVMVSDVPVPHASMADVDGPGAH